MNNLANNHLVIYRSEELYMTYLNKDWEMSEK